MRLGAGLILAILLSAHRGAAQVPPPIRSVDVIEHLGQKLPKDLIFTDNAGRTVELGSYFTGARPVVLTLVYFECPMLCNLVLNGLAKSLKAAGAAVGTDLDLVTVSFDPRDDFKAAESRRQHYLERFGLRDDGKTWPFLTGSSGSITALASAAGFGYVPVAHAREFAHPAVVVVLTADGTVSRYLYGIDPPARDMRLALAEASQGRTGSSFDRFLLHCYRYDPATRKYGMYISAFLRAGGLLVFGGLAALLFVLWRRESRREREA